MAKLKLSRKFAARDRLIRNQLSSLILFEKVMTTQAKAKALKSEAEHLVYKINSSKEDFNLVRDLSKVLYGGSIRKAIDTKGSFISVSMIKSDTRYGDGAKRALVILNKKIEKEVKASKGSK
jgi:ribosomal protein L17